MLSHFDPRTNANRRESGFYQHNIRVNSRVFADHLLVF